MADVFIWIVYEERIHAQIMHIFTKQNNYA